MKKFTDSKPLLGKTYLLKLNLKKDRKIEVGKLGFIDFKKGFYFYVGSARKNLIARIKRHLNKDKKIFWHIDYFLDCKDVKVKEVWITDREECKISQAFLRKGFSFIERFGSSDCQCKSHLFFSRNNSLELNLSLKRFNLISSNFSF